jgi:hypothetical protein
VEFCLDKLRFIEIRIVRTAMTEICPNLLEKQLIFLKRGLLSLHETLPTAEQALVSAEPYDFARIGEAGDDSQAGRGGGTGKRRGFRRLGGDARRPGAAAGCFGHDTDPVMPPPPPPPPFLQNCFATPLRGQAQDQTVRCSGSSCVGCCGRPKFLTKVRIFSLRIISNSEKNRIA